jgi:hypothetical protein
LEEVSMRLQDHPRYQAWLEAQETMIEAEKAYFEAIALDQSEAERAQTKHELHRARQAYWDVADNLENPNAPPSRTGPFRMKQKQ